MDATVIPLVHLGKILVYGMLGIGFVVLLILFAKAWANASRD